MEILTEDITMC